MTTDTNGVDAGSGRAFDLGSGYPGVDHYGFAAMTISF
jgi:hypothetical protein